MNLHCLKTEGTSFASNEARFASIAASVLAEGIDVVLAQEVCASGAADGIALFRGALEKATGATWSSAKAFAHRAWAGTPDEADEAVAIFSRAPLFAAREFVHRTQGGIRRVVLGATLTTPFTTTSKTPIALRAYSVHLDHMAPAVRAEQAREVASLAMVETDDEKLGLDVGGGAVAMPILVGGDFNAESGTEATQALVDFGFVENGPSETGIDHVFSHRSAPFTATHRKLLFTGAAAVSDHPGVLVRFASAPPKAVRLTRIVADVTVQEPLSVRGDRAPLSWTRGWPAFAWPASGKAGTALVTSELASGPFAYKFLRQDREWAVGGDASGLGEADNPSTPSFP